MSVGQGIYLIAQLTNRLTVPRCSCSTYFLEFLEQLSLPIVIHNFDWE